MAKIDFREFFGKEPLLILTPEDIGPSAREFVSVYGSYMHDVGIVAKRASGYATYASRTAPVESEHNEMFEEWITLLGKLKIKSAVAMDFYTDKWFAKDPKYQTINAKGQAVQYQVCPNREEFWQYGAEIVKELGSHNIDEIIVFGAGFIQDGFCFCERCKNEFAPMVGQEPHRLTYAFLTENPEHHEAWHNWRVEKVSQGITQLKAAARETDDMLERETPLKLTIEFPVDPQKGLTDGARAETGLDYSKIFDITGNILINLYPWTPILPSPGSKDYEDLLEALYFVKEFKRRGGNVTLYRWGMNVPDRVDELRRIAKDAEIDRISFSFHFPDDYAARRESALGSM
ncbi:MAG: hypothetical protein K9W43_01905 [Candidatus Thorarchaeota archaeon]|nr:hypothetical protein [Candidatus Thorarchaeota archaeon]